MRLGVIESTFEPLRIDAAVAREWGRLAATVQARGGWLRIPPRLPGYERFRARPETQPYGLIGPVRLVAYGDMPVTRR